MKYLSYRNRFFITAVLGLIALAGFYIHPASAFVTNTGVLGAPDYTMQPPAKGLTYVDPVFGTTVKRLTDAMNTPDTAQGSGNVVLISQEYSTMPAFNENNTRLLLDHKSYFALYDGAGNYVKDLWQYGAHASSQPRWSRQDPDVFYFLNGNQVKKFNAATSTVTVLHTFSEYSTITGMGESDLSFDGNYMVLNGNSRYIFTYNIPTDTKGNVLDLGGQSFDSLYMTPDNNVLVGFIPRGSTRYTGVEMYDKNMNFLRQVTHTVAHMDVARDTNGDEVLIFAAGSDPQPPISCEAGVVKVRLSDAKQTCVWRGDWSLALHISAPDNSGWFFMDIYAPSDPQPGTSGWVTYTNEILQVKLDGTEVRRLAHHRSRPYNGYTYQPKASASHDGTKLLYASNFGLQKTLGYPTDYSDAYMIDLASTGSTTTPTPTPSTTPSTTTPTPTTGTTTPAAGTTTSATPTANTGRIEETNAAVTYGGVWFPKTGSTLTYSGGTATMAMGTTASTSLTFNGTGVSFIAYRDQWAGIARITVDDRTPVTVDTYASPEKTKDAVYTVTNLNAGTHTIKIEPTGTQNPSSGGAWIWIDAFDVTGDTTTTTPPPTTSSPAATTSSPAPTTSSPTPTTSSPAPAPSTPPAPAGTPYHLEQSSNSIRFSGYWYENRSFANSGGSAKLSMASGARASLTFVGKSVSLTGYRDSYSGIARISIDGGSPTEVDLYAAAAEVKANIYSNSNLDWGSHTVTIEVAGRHSASSHGSWVWVDAFDYTGDAPSPVSQTTARPSIAGGTNAISTSGQSIRVGSAEVNARFGGFAPTGLAIFGYHQNSVLISEAAVSGSAPMLKGRIYAQVEGAVNTGIAIENPNDVPATIAFAFADANGSEYGQGTFSLPPHGQLSKFLDQAPFNGVRPTNGTFTFSSNVSVSAVALRGFTNERSEFLITTLPVADPDLWLPATMLFPQVAAGAGWSTTFILVNPSDQTITGTINLFQQGTSGSTAGVLNLTVDGASRSSFSYSIPARSSRRYATSGSGSSIQVGSAHMTPAAGETVPAAVAVFSFKSGGVTISEAGVAASGSGPAFRMYVEAEQQGAIRTGIAVTNSSAAEQRVNVELFGLDGAATALKGTLVIPGFGQRAAFLNEIPGLSAVPASFKGLVRIASENHTDIGVAGLRARVNERGEFLITTTDPTDEEAPASSKTVLPHIVDGGGYTTQFIFYSGSASEPASGDMRMYTQTGTSLSLSLTN